MREKKRCLLCGEADIRQPVIKSKIMIGYYVPLKYGGKRVARNMVSLCRFHKKIYEDWASPEEKARARVILRDHLKYVYPDWTFKDCYKEEKNDNQ